MEDRETARMRKYGESKTTRIMMATVPHVTSVSGLRKFQADGFLLTRVYVLVIYRRVWQCIIDGKGVVSTDQGASIGHRGKGKHGL